MYKIIGADGREYGPISLEQLRQWHAEGRVNAQTRVLVTGEANWKTIAELAELAAAVPSFATPQPIRPPTGPSLTGLPQRTNGFAIAGLILGIFSFVLAFCCCGGLPFNLLGLIFSLVGLSQINGRPEVYSGKGAAIAGVIISSLSLLLGIGAVLVSIALSWDEIVREIHNA